MNNDWLAGLDVYANQPALFSGDTVQSGESAVGRSVFFRRFKFCLRGG